MKKILLINPNVKIRSSDDSMINRYREEPYPSVGLLYLAAALKKNGYDVSYLDVPAILKRCGITFQDNIDDFVEKTVIETYNKYKPDLAGITCLFSGKFPAAVFISTILKKMNKSLPIVLGGIHPTVFHKEILERYNCVDFAIMGEGEKSLVQLLNSLSQKLPLSGVDGLCFRDGDKIVANPKKDFINDLDSLSYHSLDILRIKDYEIEQEVWRKYWHNPKRYALKYRWPFLSSRSCPLRCNFCAVHMLHGKKIRFRSVCDCFKEIEWLYDKYGINYFSIIDDNFTADKRRVIRLSQSIKKKKLKIYIDTPNGVNVNFFDKEILEALKAMGLLRIFFAIESGSDYIRNKIIGKGLSQEKIFETFNLMRKEKDVFVRAFFIVGLPQETSKTLDETYNMIKKLYVDDISIHFATPFPGTRLYEEVIKNKLLLIPEHDAVYAENFHQASDTPWIKPYNLGVEELIKFREKVKNLIESRYVNLKIDRKFPIHHIYS